MDQLTFVRALKQSVHDASISDVQSMLRSPPGRKPQPSLASLSKWYRALDEAERAKVAEVIALAVHSSIFGVLAALDGVRAIEGFGPKGELVLTHQENGNKVELCGPRVELLHDIYQSIVSASSGK